MAILNSHVFVVVFLFLTAYAALYQAPKPKKSHLLNIPTWNWNAGDEIVCLSEIKLGFLAQSCLAPGFSTLLTNLFSMQSLHGPNSLAKAVNTVHNQLKNVPSSSYSTHHSEPRSRRLGSINIVFKRVRSLYRSSIHRKETETGSFSAHTERSVSVPTVAIKDFSGHGSRSANPSVMLPPLLNGGHHWLTEYLRGVSMELYSASFSAAFEGMTFAQAAVLCMNKLELMLIALVISSPSPDETGEESVDYLLINPSVSSVAITEGMFGFFICDSQEIASRASYYCSSCHDALPSPSEIKECECRRRHRGLKVVRIKRRRQKAPVTVLESAAIPCQTFAYRLVESENSPPSQWSDSADQADDVDKTRDGSETTKTEREISVFDVTGVYHWAPKRSIEEVILPNNLYIPSTIRKETARTYMRNHILVCLLAAPSAPLLGLRSFVLPLRASNIESRQIRPIVFLGDLEFLRQEWEEISDFPKIFILPGSPLSRKDLWRARIHVCSVCVVLGISDTVCADDPYLVDKEVILCALNIRALKIPHGMQELVSNEGTVRCSGAEIPLLTALTMDSNIHFLDPEDFETGKSDVNVYLTIPFARGLAFSASVLDALVSTAYFDRRAMTLIRYLVTGGTTPVLEQWASYGGEFCENMDIQEDASGKLESDLAKRFIETLSQNNYKRPQISQMSFQDPRLASIRSTNGSSKLRFGNLFCQAITRYGILCLGLFRLSPSGKIMVNTRTDPSWSQFSRDVYDVQGPLRLPRRSNIRPPQDISQVRYLSKTRDLRSQAQLPSCAANLQVPPPALSKDDDHHDSSVSLKVISQQNYSAANSRYVITSPPNDFPVYDTDLVFCLTPHL